jgi:hypothetical protein
VDYADYYIIDAVRETLQDDAFDDTVIQLDEDEQKLEDNEPPWWWHYREERRRLARELKEMEDSLQRLELDEPASPVLVGIEPTGYVSTEDGLQPMDIDIQLVDVVTGNQDQSLEGAVYIPQAVLPGDDDEIHLPEESLLPLTGIVSQDMEQWLASMDIDFKEPTLQEDDMDQDLPFDEDSYFWEMYDKEVELMAVSAEVSKAANDFDFFAPPLKAGPLTGDFAWLPDNESRVRGLIKNGFYVNINIAMRGTEPRKLDLSDPREAAYVTALVRDGVLTAKYKPRFTAHHFFIYTETNMRLIFDGRKHNAAARPPPHFNMKSYKTNAILSKRFAYGAKFDLKNAFFSIKLQESCWPFFGIRTTLGDFCYTRLPFGFAWCPFICHIVVDAVIKYLLFLFKGDLGTGKFPDCGITHYMDDILVYADTQSDCDLVLEKSMAMFTDIVGFRISSKKTRQASQNVETLGIGYDLKNKYAYPLKSSIALCLREVKYFIQKKRITKRQMAAIIGTIGHWNNAFPGLISLLSPMIRFINYDDPWNHLYDELTSHQFSGLALILTTGIDKLLPMPIQSHGFDPFWTWYTDATPTQICQAYGLPKFPVLKPVFGQPRKTYEVYSWQRKVPEQHIAKTEALAITEFITTQWQNALDIYWAGPESEDPEITAAFSTDNVRIMCDNMAVVGAFKKGRSNVKELNDMCIALLQSRLDGSVIDIKYVNTAFNLADFGSRIDISRLPTDHNGYSFVSYDLRRT